MATVRKRKTVHRLNPVKGEKRDRGVFLRFSQQEIARMVKRAGIAGLGRWARSVLLKAAA